MSRHLCALWIICLSLGLSGTLLAQDSIPDAVKNGSIGPTERGTIDAFVTAQLKGLTSDNVTDQTRARDRLVQETMSSGSAAPPAFLDAYAEALNRGLPAVLATGASPRQRLLGAIVAAKVADIARNTRLLDVVLLELKDEQLPVVLWGMKGARAILPAVLNNALLRQQGLLPREIVEAVKRTGSVPVVQEAYGAAMLGLFASPSRQPSVAEIQTDVPMLQELLAERVEEYHDGIPEQPTTENTASLFLSHPSIWPQQTPPQQQRTASELMTLLSFAAQRYKSDPSGLTPVIQQTSKAMYIITNDAALQAALVGLTRMTPQTSADEVERDVQSVYTALTAIAQFKDTPKPVKLGAWVDESTTAP